jgi:Uncharacterised protein conserved in bacteria (DUF2336)
MNTSQSIVADLEAAIHGGSQERRNEMLRRVTDLFVGNAEGYGEEQVVLFGDVLGLLTKQVESHILVELSAKLAPVDNAPHSVVQDLARHDEITVAGPVLEHSNQLSDRDLIEIAETKGQQHLGAISERKRIAAAVTDILVERGDSIVVRKLSRNQGASFSNSGFVTLTKRAETDESLAENLALRMDLPSQLLEQLVSKATEAVRMRLAAQLEPEAHGVLKDLLSSASDKTLREAALPRDFKSAEKIIDDLQKSGQFNEVAVCAFAAAARYEEMVVGVARLGSAPVELIERLMKNPRYDGVLIACKACGLHWPSFKAILTNRFSGHQVTQAELERARADFIKLSAATAQRMFRFWLIRGVAK